MTVAEVAEVAGSAAVDLASVKIRELYRSRPETETEKVYISVASHLLLPASGFWIIPASKPHRFHILEATSCTGSSETCAVDALQHCWFTHG